MMMSGRLGTRLIGSRRNRSRRTDPVRGRTDALLRDRDDGSGPHACFLKAAFTFTLECDLPAPEAWSRVADSERHGVAVPFTNVSGPKPENLRVGSRLVARTALGPCGFDDVMIVRAAEPGRLLVFEKVGRVIGGVVDVRFTPLPALTDARGMTRPVSTGGVRPDAPSADGGNELTRVEWRQTIAVPWLRGPLTPLGTFAATLASPLARRGYERVVARVLTGVGGGA